MKYPINEIFATIQGEATYTGTSSLFIRMQFCDVGCPWCDTKHTWAMDEDAETTFVPDVLGKDEDSSVYAWVHTGELVKIALDNRPNHVVITGGEPCAYDLTELTTALINNGFTVQVETSGTYPIRCHTQTWVTVSPKVNMPGGKKVLQESLDRANEIKHPVGKEQDILNLQSLMQNRHKTIWLQPLSQAPKPTALCVNAALDHNWKVSIQTHKFINVR